MYAKPIFHRTVDSFQAMLRPFQSAFLFLSLCGLLTTHAADLRDFVGHWRGDAIESSDGLEVVKEQVLFKFSSVDDGFKLEWNTPGGDVEQAVFVESETQPGVFSVRASSGGLLGFLSSSGEVNPLEGDPLTWAHLEADSLIVYKLVIDDQGAFTIDRYENAMQGETIQLRFTRRSQGDSEKAFVAKLKRAGE